MRISQEPTPAVLVSGPCVCWAAWLRQQLPSLQCSLVLGHFHGRWKVVWTSSPEEVVLTSFLHFCHFDHLEKECLLVFTGLTFKEKWAGHLRLTRWHGHLRGSTGFWGVMPRVKFQACQSPYSQASWCWTLLCLSPVVIWAMLPDVSLTVVTWRECLPSPVAAFKI